MIRFHINSQQSTLFGLGVTLSTGTNMFGARLIELSCLFLWWDVALGFEWA
jgi:hypothetical protein